MNASILSRPLKPILGSGGDLEGGIFTATGHTPPMPRAPHFADVLSWPAPVAESQPPAPEAPAAESSAAQSGAAKSGAAEPAAPAIIVSPAPSESLPIVVPPEASLHRPLPPPPPEERIIVEKLGLQAIRVTGTSHGDQLFGGPGDDRLDGLAGNDILVGSPGRDLLYGGAGHDTIRYDLLRAEVSLDTRFQRISLEDGEDQYDGIEVIDLRDGDWILTADSPAALVQRLYLAATGHAPSTMEMIREAAALESGGTAEALATRLAAGAGEAVQLRIQAALDAPREGRLEQPVWVADADAMLLTRLCELGLGGTPDRDAFLHWLDELEGGQSADSVAAELLATPEGQVAYADGHALAVAASSWML
jgi:hypothetical protein